MINPFDLTGKVTLVTGANSGLGLGFAEGIAAAGGDLVIWGRRPEQNEQAAEALRRFGTRVLAQAVDVADEAAVRSTFGDAVAAMGRVHGVVVNAGISSPAASFEEMTSEQYHALIDINQHGAFYTLHEAVRHMRPNGGGSIVTCGSLSCVSGIPKLEHYAAAKGALMAMTRSIAVEYGVAGIRANMILPGRITTSLGTITTQSNEERERRMRGIPIPRFGTPADCAGLVVYLLSDASSYQTGSMVPVDGGLSIALR